MSRTQYVGTNFALAELRGLVSVSCYSGSSSAGTWEAWSLCGECACTGHRLLIGINDLMCIASLLVCMVIPQSFPGLAVLRTLLGAAEACVTVCAWAHDRHPASLKFYMPSSLALCFYWHDSTKEKSSLSSKYRFQNPL